MSAAAPEESKDVDMADAAVEEVRSSRVCVCCCRCCCCCAPWTVMGTYTYIYIDTWTHMNSPPYYLLVGWYLYRPFNPSFTLARSLIHSHSFARRPRPSRKNRPRNRARRRPGSKSKSGTPWPCGRGIFAPIPAPFAEILSTSRPLSTRPIRHPPTTTVSVLPLATAVTSFTWIAFSAG